MTNKPLHVAIVGARADRPEPRRWIPGSTRTWRRWSPSATSTARTPKTWPRCSKHKIYSDYRELIADRDVT